MVKKIILGTLVGCFLLGVLSGPCFSADNGPTKQIQTSVDAIIAILKEDALLGIEKSEIKKGKILEEVDRRFNFNLMSKLSLGNAWDQISEQQQAQFARLFGDLLKNTYINRIEGYSDEKVVYGQEFIKDDLAQVSSMFEKNNERMSIVYKLRREKDIQWLVYDVIIEGASIIKQYRRQFAEIMDREDFNGLILRLEDKMKAINTNKS